MSSIVGLFKELQILVSNFFIPISASPLHVHYTALPNIPTTTFLYQTYAPTLFALQDKTLDRIQKVETVINEVKQYGFCYDL
jgi:hypothetical protein